MMNEKDIVEIRKHKTLKDRIFGYLQSHNKDNDIDITAQDIADICEKDCLNKIRTMKKQLLPQAITDGWKMKLHIDGVDCDLETYVKDITEMNKQLEKENAELKSKLKLLAAIC